MSFNKHKRWNIAQSFYEHSMLWEVSSSKLIIYLQVLFHIPLHLTFVIVNIEFWWRLLQYRWMTMILSAGWILFLFLCLWVVGAFRLMPEAFSATRWVLSIHTCIYWRCVLTPFIYTRLMYLLTSTVGKYNRQTIRRHQQTTP